MVKAFVVETCVSDRVVVRTTDGSASVSVGQSPAVVAVVGEFEQSGGDFVVDDGHSAFIGGLNSPTVQLIGKSTVVVATGSGNLLDLRGDSGADVELRSLAGSATVRAEGPASVLDLVAGSGSRAQLASTSGSVVVQSSGTGNTVEILGNQEAGVHVATNAVIAANSAPIVVENIGYNILINVGDSGNLRLSNPSGNILNIASQVANNVSNFGVQAANSIELQGSSSGAQILLDLPSHSSSVLLANTGEIVVTNPVPTSAGAANFTMAGARLFASDPDVGGGFAAPVNSFGVQTTASTLWFKSGAGDTDWVELGGGGGGGGTLFDTVLTPATFSFPNNDVPLALGQVTLVKYTTDGGGATSRAFRGLLNTNGGNTEGLVVCFLNENGTPAVPVNGALLFQNEDTGSVDSNRFRTTGTNSASGNSQGAVWFIYEGSGVDGRWQQFSNTSG